VSISLIIIYFAFFWPVKGPKCPLSLGLSGSNRSTLLATHGRFFLPILHDPHQDPALTRRSGRPCTAAGAGRAASRLLHVPALADVVPDTAHVPSLGAAGPHLSPAPSELCISLLRLRRSYSSRRRDLSPPFSQINQRQRIDGGHHGRAPRARGGGGVEVEREERRGGAAVVAQLLVVTLAMRAISRARPRSSRETLFRPCWRGKLAPSGWPRPGRRRPDARRGAGKCCDEGNQTWAVCNDSSRMGLWTAPFRQPITPLVTF
jgi:hypothetical protein